MLVWICQLEVNLSEKQTHMFVIKEKKILYLNCMI